MKKIGIAIISICLFSCAAKELSQKGQQVRFLQTEPKGCKYLGEATGNQGNFFTGSWTSNQDLETGARNVLKNKAADMGGNVVVVLTNRAGQTGSSHGEYGGSSSQTNVTITGTVHHCPESVLQP